MSVHTFRRLATLLSAVCVLAAATSVEASAASPSKVLRWIGDSSSATGNALGQGSCDVNGDGFDDSVVGAWFWDKAPNNNIGASYVIFGGREIKGGDLNTPSAAGAARIDGPNVANGFSAFSVACAGDVNGDDIDDIAISYYTKEKVFVVLGAEDFGSPDLTNLGDRGYEIQGDLTDALDYNVGFSMAPAGDVNDDGFDDFAVAGVVADTRGRTNNGRVWIVAGKEDVANVNLIDPAPGEVLQTIDGAQSEARLGQIAPAGDVNGDGTDDVVLGAYTATPHGSSVAVPGQAWVLYGGSDPTIDLNALGDNGFTILGPTRGRDRLGISVSAAGDVDGDGLDDVIVGGDGVYNAATGQRPGSAWVVRGSTGHGPVLTDTSGVGPAVYDCVDDDADSVCDPEEKESRGYWIKGADSDPGTASEGTGYSLSDIGDVNGDDRPDFAIGAYGYDPPNPASPGTTMNGAGAVFVVYGKADGATEDLATLTTAQGYRIDGLAAGDRFGRQVAKVGDADGNGIGDFAVGADFANRTPAGGAARSQAGEVAVALLGPLATDLDLSSTATGPLEVGDEIDLDADVDRLAGGRAPVPSGTVDFTVDGDPIDGCQDVPADPATGNASCDGVSFDHFGTYALAAAYDGGADYGDAAATAPLQDVVEDSATTLSTSGTTVRTGDPVTFTAEVEASPSATAASAGTVSFATGDGPIAGCEAVTVTGGAAICTTAFGQAGDRSVTAAYSGTSTLRGSTSATATLRIEDPPPGERPEAGPAGPAGSIELAAAEVGIGGKRRSGVLGRTRCLLTGCRIDATSTRVRIGRDRYAVELLTPAAPAAGSAGSVRVRLTRAGRRALKRTGRGFLPATVSVAANGGRTVQAGRVFELVPRSAR